jgi:uncharacterized surface protein with fasciclin (FAS1) repeats
MKFSGVLPAAFAGAALAQDGSSSLVDAIEGQDGLSLLGGLLGNSTSLLGSLSNATNITVLAPSDSALRDILNSTMLQDLPDVEGYLTAILQYHVLNGTFYAANVTNSSMFIPTMLSNSSWENVSGAQVVEAMAAEDDEGNKTVSFYGALKQQANVTEADIEFEGGVIHIINELLMVPMNLTETAIEGSLSAVAGALNMTEQGPDLEGLMNITVFAPNNDAFASIASVVGNLSTEELSSILEYHVISGTVLYSSDLSNGTQETLGGEDVEITISEDGDVFVNAARVVVPDILIANGVVHVIDNVLNPNGTDSENEPDPSATEPATPAFSGASTATDGNVPFTSGQPTPTATETNTDLNEGGDAGGDEEDAAPRASAGVLMGALFGGAAIMFNNF